MLGHVICYMLSAGNGGEGLKKYKILYLNAEGDWEDVGSPLTQQCEVSPACLLAADITSIIHAHRVSDIGGVVIVLQSFL